MKKALPIIILILLIAVSIVAWQVTKKEALPTVSCTQEAMLCPDGSYVGRTGPKCEFASCPVKSSANLSQTGLGQSSGSDKNTGANSAKNVTTDEASPVPQRSPTLLSPLNPPATTVQPTALPSNTDEPPFHGFWLCHPGKQLQFWSEQIKSPADFRSASGDAGAFNR